MNPMKTHNYLEMTYTIEQLLRNEQTMEASVIRGAPFYGEYYVFK
jgi:hypothetical protein